MLTNIAAASLSLALAALLVLPTAQPIDQRTGSASPTATPTVQFEAAPDALELTEEEIAAIESEPLDIGEYEQQIATRSAAVARRDAETLWAALNQIAPEEQQRLAAAAALASRLATSAAQGPTTADVVLLNRLFVPVMVYQQAPPPPTPEPTATAQPTATPRPTARPTARPDDDDDDDDDDSAADLAVVLRASPSIRVARDGTLSIEVRLANPSDRDVDRTVVRVDYDRDLMSLRSRSLDRRDKLGKVTSDYVEVLFGRLDHGRERKATLRFRVGKRLGDNTVLAVRAHATWSGRGTVSNWTPVLVGGGNDTSPYAWMEVQPERGRAGSTHRFFTDRFIPGERVAFWLNTPRGVEGLSKADDADGFGRVWAEFNTRGRERGTYSLVARGERSGIQAVRSFVVE